MSHFYGSMKGSRGEATRCGTASSGFSAHIRGWHIGARVELSQSNGGEDVVRVYRTSGSNASESDELIAEYTATNGSMGAPTLFRPSRNADKNPVYAPLGGRF